MFGFMELIRFGTFDVSHALGVFSVEHGANVGSIEPSRSDDDVEIGMLRHACGDKARKRLVGFLLRLNDRKHLLMDLLADGFCKAVHSHPGVGEIVLDDAFLALIADANE
jgi:glycosylphosphatidylinositol transamidase (GPIT) subunit GPI8